MLNTSLCDFVRRHLNSRVQSMQYVLLCFFLDDRRGRSSQTEKEEADQADGATRYSLPSNLTPERRALIACRRAERDRCLSERMQRQIEQRQRWNAAVIASFWKKWCVRAMLMSEEGSGVSPPRGTSGFEATVLQLICSCDTCSTGSSSVSLAREIFHHSKCPPSRFGKRLAWFPKQKGIGKTTGAISFASVPRELEPL